MSVCHEASCDCLPTKTAGDDCKHKRNEPQCQPASSNMTKAAAAGWHMKKDKQNASHNLSKLLANKAVST